MPPLGGYMARLFTGERVFLRPVLGPVERFTYRLLRVDPQAGQDWKAYARTLLLFSSSGWLALYLILRTQTLHPFNPEGFHSGTWDVSFNTASSFLTNTDWQFYGGETTMSYFSQMAGPGGPELPLGRRRDRGRDRPDPGDRNAARHGRTRTSPRARSATSGDLTKALLYVLLPISIIAALVLVSQGTLQTLGGSVGFHGVSGAAASSRVGPVASQEAIKELGTNGGGFFNVNSAMPFENPTTLSNFLELWLILLIPVALTWTYGRMVGSRRQGYAILAAMAALFVISIASSTSPRARHAGAASRRRPHAAPRRLDGRQHGGQGAALRDRQLALWTAVTTVTSAAP